jgi:dTDP-4-amino-4,6-dideoxygalactose transaminase
LATYLRERGVSTGRHYPQPPHLALAFADLGLREGSFPVAEAIARETLSLPIFPGISERQLEAVASAVSAFFASGAGSE